jgi:hypothetical protein
MAGRIPFRHIPVSIARIIIHRKIWLCCHPTPETLRLARRMWSAAACRRFAKLRLAGAVWTQRKPRVKPACLPASSEDVNRAKQSLKSLKFAPLTPIIMLEVLSWQTLSAQFRALCSPHTLLRKAQFATQHQTQLRNSTPYIKTRFRSANRAQPQVKPRPHRRALKAQANRNLAKSNKEEFALNPIERLAK